MDDLPDDFESRLTYCIAYGEAARLAVIARFGHAFGRDAAARRGARAEKIERELTRRVRLGSEPELIKRAVEDALENRRPRW
jgi:hypothetical protein